MTLAKPEPTEYAPYYEKYVALVLSGDVVAELDAQHTRTLQLLSGRTERDGKFRYAPEKWTIKEVIGHIADAERIFTYRALRIARGDQTPLPGFEQDGYVNNGAFGDRTLASVVEEFSAVRKASLALFQSLGDQAWLRRGTASNNEVTVRALAFITAGHELHHARILKERYLPALPPA